jgi:hypothetical protein
LDGLCHGKSCENGWFRSPILGNLHFLCWKNPSLLGRKMG